MSASSICVWTPCISWTQSVQPASCHSAHATYWHLCLQGGKTHRVTKTIVLCAWAVGHNLQWTVKPRETLTSLHCLNVWSQQDNARWKQQENNEEWKRKKQGFFLFDHELRSKNTFKWLCYAAHSRTNTQIHAHTASQIRTCTSLLTANHEQSLFDIYWRLLQQNTIRPIVCSELSFTAVIAGQYNTFLLLYVHPVSI